MLLDSNIIIYAAQPSQRALRQFVATHSPVVSAVSYVEVMGYHGLTEVQRRYFGLFFAAAPILSISEPIVQKAVELKQRQKMTLGDALIAATALVHKLTLVTHNTQDFKSISELALHDPVEESS